MDEEIRTAFEAFTETQTALMASFTLAQARLRAHQQLLVALAEKLGVAGIRGLSTDQWLLELTEKYVHEHLLTCKDGQMAGRIRDELEKLKNPTKE